MQPGGSQFACGLALALAARSRGGRRQFSSSGAAADPVSAGAGHVAPRRGAWHAVAADRHRSRQRQCDHRAARGAASADQSLHRRGGRAVRSVLDQRLLGLSVLVEHAALEHGRRLRPAAGFALWRDAARWPRRAGSFPTLRPAAAPPGGLAHAAVPVSQRRRASSGTSRSRSASSRTCGCGTRMSPAATTRTTWASTTRKWPSPSRSRTS